jgi:molybdopterin/thiamine biosynthesis adenylyltransferase
MSYIDRFERHIDIPEIGLRGQDKLTRSSALIVGAGGLGCPASLYLAAAGIGVIGLVDEDTVSLSNLQRQILYGEDDVGKKKTETAERQLGRISSACNVRSYAYNLNPENASAITAPYDIVLDCTDNFETRFLINRICHLLGKKLISASLYHHDGQISVFKSFEGAPHPCYECLYANTIDKGLVPNCRQSGVVGPVAGILGAMQASAAINELLGIGESLSGWMFMFNALNFETEKVKISRKKNCPCCSRENALTC